MPNLVSPDKKKLKDILGLAAAGSPVTPAEVIQMRALKDVMRPNIPYDKLHPNFSKLTPIEQNRLKVINNKLGSGLPLTVTEGPELHRMKDFLDDPTPFNEQHPHFSSNLNPR